MCSLNWRPGKLVSIGRNSPRISAGASGFMSHMSRWLGPPLRNTRIQASARGFERGTDPVAVCARSNWGRLRPRKPMPPICTIERREIDRGPRQGRGGGMGNVLALVRMTEGWHRSGRLRSTSKSDVLQGLFQGTIASARAKVARDVAANKKTRPPPRGPGTARENDACSCINESC